jgi:ribosomal protein S18 acetylase RimI-like enzyme
MSFKYYVKRFLKHLPIFRKDVSTKKIPETRLQMKYVFTGSEDFSLYKQLPDGFFEVRYFAGLEYKWLELINSSGEFGVWNIDLLKKKILKDLVDQGGVLVSSGNSYVACASICERDDFKPNALLMYVIVKKEYRGLGLGKFVSTHAMSTAQQLGYPGVVLRTDDYRVPAIKMYSQLGFLYDYESGLYSMSKWNALVYDIINHTS